MALLQVLFSGFPMTATAFLIGLWFAFILDLCFGDPRCLPHPVMLIASIAKNMESFLRESDITERLAGLLTVIGTLALGIMGAVFLLVLLWRLSPWVLFIGSVVLFYTTLAQRGLADHALAVYQDLQEGAVTGDLQPARESVGRIVGRDTTQLDENAIVCACVESVAENLSDGVIAPLFYAVAAALFCLVSGCAELSMPAAATAALLYKAVNTMDSMFGYKNDRYLHFGRAAAMLDDAVNFIPARLSGIALVVTACITGKNGRQAWKVLRRDRMQHASPNAGYPEAAMAGALGLQLGGESRYFGMIIEKPTIGDGSHIPDKEHIRSAVRLMGASSLVFTVGFSMLYLTVLLFLAG